MEDRMEPAIILALFLSAVLGILVVMVATALLGWLWNITIPDIFGIRQITFWEAFRLLLISAILFSGPLAQVDLSL